MTLDMENDHGRSGRAKNMDTANATQLSDEFQSALSEILPDLYQLLQSYQISSPLGFSLDVANPGSQLISIKQCIRCDGLPYCYPQVPPNPNCPIPRPFRPDSEFELDFEQTQQFCADLASQMSRLGESVQQTDESFEINILINPSAVNNNLSCQFVDGILLCSDQPQ